MELRKYRRKSYNDCWY